MQKKVLRTGLVSLGVVLLMFGYLEAAVGEMESYRKEKYFWYDWTYNNYDYFGNFIPGFLVYQLSDVNAEQPWQFTDPVLLPRRGSVWKRNWGLSGRSVDESAFEVFTLKYKGLKNKLTLDRELWCRTKFTPLTLDLPPRTGRGVSWSLAKEKFATTLYVAPLSDLSVSTEKPTEENTYLLAARAAVPLKTEKLVDLNVGITYANIHDDDSGYGQNLYGSGAVPALSRMSVIGLKFSDDSPQDGKGAHCYGVRTFIDDQEQSNLNVSGVTLSKGVTLSEDENSSVGVGYRAADGAASFVYEFDLAQSNFCEAGGKLENVKSVDFKIRLANDFCVQQTFRDDTGALRTGLMALRAEENSQDDKKEWHDYKYLLRGGIGVAGVDIEGELLGMDVSGEICVNQTFDQTPEGKDKSKRVSSYFVRASRPIVKKEKYSFGLGGEVYNMDKDYETSFTSHWDGARHDLIAPQDAQYYFTGSPLAFDRPEGNIYLSKWIDRDANGIPDWNEDFGFFFQNEEPFFMLGLSEMKDKRIIPGAQNNGVIGKNNGIVEDRNNNGIIDGIEIDSDPNYPYDEEQNGFGFYLDGSLWKKVGWIVGQVYDKNSIRGTDSSAQYGLLKYRHELKNFGPLIFQQEVKKVKDTIYDDKYGIPLTDLAPTKDNIREDPRDFEDSLVGSTFLEFDYNPDYGKESIFKYDKKSGDIKDMDKGRKNILWVNRLRFIGNHQYNKDRTIYQSGLMTKFGYRWKPAKPKDLVILPLAKFVLRENMASPADPLFRLSQRTGAAMLRTDYKLTRTTHLVGGLQYKIFRDIINDGYNYDKGTVVLQMQMSARGFLLYLGARWDNVDYLRAAIQPDGYKDNKAITWFIRIYVRG